MSWIARSNYIALLRIDSDWYPWNILNSPHVEYFHMTKPTEEKTISKKFSKHLHQSVSFAARSIEQLSSISNQLR